MFAAGDSWEVDGNYYLESADLNVDWGPGRFEINILGTKISLSVSWDLPVQAARVIEPVESTLPLNESIKCLV